MKTQIFAALLVAIFLPTSIFGQWQTNLGDCGEAGQFIPQQYVSQGCASDCGDGPGICSGQDRCSSVCGGPYISVFGGLQQLDDQGSTGFQRQVDIGFDDGFAVGAAIGKRFNRIFRAEVEYVYRESDAETAFFNWNAANFVDGKTHSNTGMFNGYFDLPIGSATLVPYIGGGVGITGVDSDVQYGNSGSTLNGNDSSLAYQWIVGLTFRALPNAECFVEYRYFEANDPKLNRFGGPPINGVIPNVILDSEYKSRDVFIGVRMNF